MTSNNQLDFLNRDCQQNKHHQCVGRWHGLGYEIYCYCKCHDEKEEALDWVEVSAIHAVQLGKPSMEVAQI